MFTDGEALAFMLGVLVGGTGSFVVCLFVLGRRRVMSDQEAIERASLKSTSTE